MTPQELESAIRYLKPEAQFSFTEADYDSIKWDVIEGQPPSLADIEKAVEELKKQELAKVEAKAQLLNRLGITEAESRLLIA